MPTLTTPDGTTIAYDTTGRGPALILVDGAFCTRTFGPSPKLAPLLADQFTVVTYDRRGRGDSSDTAPYDIERELDDLRALIEVVGGSAHLLGFSSGGILALRAAAAGLPITKLAVYEPPFDTGQVEGHRVPPDAVVQLTELIAAGRRGPAVKYFLTRIMGAPAAFYYAMRLMPMWPKMKAVASSLPHDAAIVTAEAGQQPRYLASIDQPILAVGGAKSSAMLQAAVRCVADGARRGEHRLLAGQTHNVSTKVLAPLIRDFFATSRRCAAEAEDGVAE
jgi:pimeloyl-ACP methyl ester carboxylesterase